MAGHLVAPIAHRGTWSHPDITLHDTARSLLDELIPYRVVHASSEIDAPGIKAGALLCGAQNSSEALQRLSSTIGVDLTNPDYRYALVKLSRIDGTDSHASAASGILVHARPRLLDTEYGLSSSFAAAVVKLRHAGRSRLQDYGDKLSKEVATKILDSFGEFGTHYVSAIELGDVILQVFAYPSEQFATIKKAYHSGENPLSGPGAEDFAQFTTDLNTGIFGFVKQCGNIINLSNSSVFNETLKNGDWFDSLWSHQNSVFALFNTDAKLSLTKLQQDFSEQTAVEVQLASLSVMIEQKRGLIWQRIFKGALVQKYRTSIEANFAVYDQRNFVKMLPEDQSGIVSFIATPSVNVYKTRLNIAEMQFVAADQVQNFTLFANVLSAESSAPISLPGKQVRLFGQVIDMRTDSQPKMITVADAAYDALQIACDEFLGALSIQSSSGSAFHVIVDGLKFDLEQGYPVIVEDVRQVPPISALPDLGDSLQYSMAFAEAVVSDQSCCPNDGIQLFVRQYLTWLAEFVPANSSDADLVALRVRALDLANYAIDPSYGSFVPILPYSDYESFVQSILNYLDRIRQQIAENELRLAARREEELIINVAKTLNENIIASGELISGVIDANSAQQQDLEGYYDSLIAQKQAEATQQQSKLNNLKASLFTAQGSMDLATQQYKSAVQQWQTIEAIKFGLDVATNLFSLGTSIAIPASTIGAVKELGYAVQLIQKTLNVLNATSKLYTGSSIGLKGLQGAQDTLDGLDGAQFGSPSTLNWDEMSIQFNQIIATGPDVKAEKAALQSAFSILILRGKAVTSAESSLHQIQRDIYNYQQQQELNSRQAKRWAELQNKLHPANIQNLDKNAIDLMGISGYLTNIQNQMLVILAKAFLQQDLALQYANLQPATPVTSFSLMKFSAAVVQQKANTIEAKSQLAHYRPAVTEPIDFVIDGISPSQMSGGNIFSTTIFLDASEFLSYVDARVVSVVASVDGVHATDGGIYHLRLAFNGTPFHDRNLERDALNFRTPWRERIYNYQVDGNVPAFSDGGKSWSEGVSRVTPFGAWEISFPKTDTNKGLTFNKDLLKVRLSFVLEARIVDAASLVQLRAAKQAAALATVAGVAGKDIAQTVASDKGLALLAAAPSIRAAAAAPALPPVPDLIAQMFAQGSCTNGWDVVFNLGLSEINKALSSQYDALKKDTTYKNTISVNTSEQYPGGVTVINKFTINYGYPLLTFSINNNNSALLKMEILDGSVQRCSKVGSNPEVCDLPESISGETLTAVIGLAKVAGNIQVDGNNHNVLKVLLDMAEGAFTISNIELSDATKVEFNKEVKAYFVNNPVVFLINQLDLTNIPTLNALKPNDFIFKPLQTPSGNQMLQLFIMTGGRALLNYSQAFLNNIPEPLPQGQSNSMMIRSQLIFQEALPQSLKNNGWALAGVNPGSPAKAWTGKMTSASVTGTVDLSKLNHSVNNSGGQGGGSYTQYTYSIPGGNNISWSLADTTLTTQSDGQLLYSGSHSQSLSYKEHSCTTIYPCFWNCTSCYDSMLSTDFVLNVRAVLPFSVAGSGRNQTIQIVTTGQGINVTGHLSGGGPSGSDDLKAQVNQQIESQIPGQIAGKLSIKFDAISVFALKNLLFPANNYISFSSIAVPGDLLLLGNFTD
ncbi:conserved hypothetical protein [Chloroherpeton thalassium ATCC 35110]|uniref:MACPF domain-containing protein n=1 Tax=Chloroherpeton thalassium (strain ATCC 35110 / GB-78) TaxID=517418 RepID=B3QY95_CHLT3|nr:hypothetical protein [Chloroherpeton thalassium]ACF15061.1 conserved hypothetical protein [Chloroherpeton thalassium ATCC 35110]